MAWGVPISHNFNCQSTFNFYFSTGASSWNNFTLQPTSLWGDGTATASEYGGTKYLTMRNLMFQSPHVVPSSLGGNACLRFGRGGGIGSGRWWETATRTDSKFHICLEANATTGLCIDTGGNIGVGTITPDKKIRR